MSGQVGLQLQRPCAFSARTAASFSRCRSSFCRCRPSWTSATRFSIAASCGRFQRRDLLVGGGLGLLRLGELGLELGELGRVGRLGRELGLRPRRRAPSARRRPSPRPAPSPRPPRTARAAWPRSGARCPAPIGCSHMGQRPAAAWLCWLNAWRFAGWKRPMGIALRIVCAPWRALASRSNLSRAWNICTYYVLFMFCSKASCSAMTATAAWIRAANRAISPA